MNTFSEILAESTKTINKDDIIFKKDVDEGIFIVTKRDIKGGDNNSSKGILLPIKKLI